MRITDIKAGGRRGRGVITTSLCLLLGFHAPVLEPDLDLTLCQAKVVGDLDAPPPGEVAVVVELLFKFKGLKPGVGLPGSFWAR